MTITKADTRTEKYAGYRAEIKAEAETIKELLKQDEGFRLFDDQMGSPMKMLDDLIWQVHKGGHKEC